jgi:hypothetical protein
LLDRGLLLSWIRTALLDALPNTDLESAELEPAVMLRRWLTVALWLSSITCYVGDTLLWYHISLAIVGGSHRIWTRGLRVFAWQADPTRIADDAAEKLLRGARDGWHPLWGKVLEEMYNLDLISDTERNALLSTDPGQGPLEKGVPRNPEARRRLKFLTRSLSDPRLKSSKGVLSTPGLTVLVPHYAESIISHMDELISAEAKPRLSSTSQNKSRLRNQLAAELSVLDFIIAYKPE